MEEGGSKEVWRRVVARRFGEEWGDGLLSWVWMFMGVAYGEVSIWVGRILAKILNLLLGVGNGVKFWQDGWCGDQPLQLAFLGLYNIATNREAFVESSLTRLGAGERRSWDVRFIQDLNDWELDIGAYFLCILESNTPSTDNGNWMRWKLTTNGDFDIHFFFYNKLQGSFFVVFP